MSTLNGNHDYVGDKPSPKPTRAQPSIAYKVLHTLASLRLTVVLFSLSMVLVFFGTVAMMQYSIEDTMKHYFRSWYTFIEFRTISDFGSVFFPYLFSKDHPIPGKLPFPGGYIIGWAMFINLLAAHAVRFKLTWKRSGIFMLHAGVIVLLAGEFLTGQFAIETRMVVNEGESSRYVFHLSKYELAFVDPSDPNRDDIVVVPNQLILDSGTSNWVSHPDLPVDVQLVQFFPNARLRNLRSDEQPVATRGTGVRAGVEPRPRVKGTDSTGEIDSPVIYVSFRDKSGNPLGTYLFSTRDRNQEITIDGKKYQVAYRFQREYRPYEVHVESAAHDVYDGTDTPRNYESVVQVLDPQSGQYGPVRIWMNHPMYYKGETFYQSGMSTNEETGIKTTTLQVVVNHAWTFPYIACCMVGLGMAFHFFLRLLTFLNNRKSLAVKAQMAQPAKARAIVVPGRSNAMRLVAKYFPAAIVVLSAFMLIGRCFPPSPTEGKYDYYGFGRIPVQHGGRVQPLDSLARNSLMVISGKQEYVDSTKSDRKYSAIEWLLVVWSKQDEADKFRIFRVEHLELLGLLNLPQRPGSFRYSFAEIDQKLPELENKASDAMSKPKEQRGLFEEKVLELTKHIELYRSIQFRKNPGLIPTDPYGGKWMSYGDVIEKEAPAFFFVAEQKVRQDIAAELHADPGVMSDLVRKHLGGMDRVEQAMKEAGGRDELLRMIIEAEVKLRKASLARENFLKMLPEKYPAISDFDKILANYKDSKPDDFNSSVATYHEKHTTAIPDSVLARERLEARMNYFDPFLYCYVLYIGVFLLAAFSWLVWNQPLRKAAFWLACLTLVVHTGGLVARMYIGNRPPVTNLYSAAIFIGWGSLVMCLILEPIYKLGISTFVGGLFGLCTMVVARFLAESGDTLEMLQAVLDTNFWLATHVTCVTTGYYATGFAGLLCTVYLVGGVFTPAMRGTVGKMLGSMMYGTICFATLMSFIGTVLGGIWADQSWGRFWGWDPKENGAVLIVIWNALILHARWGGLIKSRGIAVLGVIGINWMVWSWFGTNQLGIGLHAYGFDNTLVLLCVLTWLGASLIAALGMVPLKYWASFAPTTGNVKS